MWSKKFWANTAEKTIRTAAQAALAAITANGTGITDLDWLQAASMTGFAALACVLAAIAVPTVTEEPAADTDRAPGKHEAI